MCDFILLSVFVSGCMPIISACNVHITYCYVFLLEVGKT